MPVSLLAHMTETRAFFVPFSSARSWSRSNWPTWLTGSSTTVWPSAFSRRAGWSTAGCSTVVVTIFMPVPNQSAAPRMAVLSDSVAHEVKRTSSGWQLKKAATCSRAFSTCLATCPPKACIDDGLPYSSPKKGIMASRTSGATCVVALLSK